MNGIQPPRRSATRRSAGFSMIEILLATMILTVGFMMLLPAFMIGLSQSRRTLDTSMVMHVGQNASALCDAMLDTAKVGGSPNDPNFTDANITTAIHTYAFGSNGKQLGNDATIRIYGDSARSRYYWCMLYRFPNANRSLAELWIMVCKRDEASKDDAMIGVQEPVSISVSASAGATSINAGSNAAFLETGSGVVTDTGEVLRIAGRNGNDIFLASKVERSFSSVWIVKYPGASEANACIGVFHTFKGS
ncbi:MAG: hypothetical protein BIFFINMI_00978 [Phycisphaerae bacterium]|nr:hypothetical protein [Phycisphaerae bacterium]